MTPFPMSDVIGLAAKLSFHIRGVSCATSRAGWGAGEPLQHIDQPGVGVHLVQVVRRDKALNDPYMCCNEFGRQNKQFVGGLVEATSFRLLDALLM